MIANVERMSPCPVSRIQSLAHTNIQTTHFSPSLSTLNPNAGLTLSCQAFLFFFFLLEDCSRRRIDKWFHSLLPEEERMILNGSLKLRECFQVEQNPNLSSSLTLLQPALLSITLLPLFLSFYPLRDPKKPLVDKLPHKAETGHSEIRDHVLFTDLLKIWSTGLLRKKKKRC